ncbi:MAG: putative anaerobic dimethyl sulfoxide reductase, chain reductase precursor [Firmicutes bacterium]|nr:putative anaerobic dimethyl sulfoxide reductase, chain reductase precursor [Bacillota bacterium]
MITKRRYSSSGTLGLTWKEAIALAQNNGEQVVPTFCAMCGPTPLSCGVYAFVKDGRFTNVAGMQESPNNKGAVCPKGHAAPQWVYSPDRLKYPMKRVGSKGEGKFARISWDEAIGIIADTLKSQKEKYGPESLAILAPAMRTYNAYIKRFLTVHGSPNYGHSGICALQRGFSFMYTIADWPVAEIDQSDLVIYWGRQPIFSGPAMDGPRLLLKVKERGAKIVAIKPSAEPDVGKADIWLPLRPGTDAALALAMLHVVVNEELIDKEFVEKWCYGYELLKEHIQKYPPAWAEKITGVAAEQIYEVARLYATTKRASIDLGNGVEHAPSANDSIRAVAILIAITGHLDRPGGNVFRSPETVMPMPMDITLRDRYTEEMRDKLVAPEFPKEFQPFVEGFSSAYYRIFDSILTGNPYQIRTVIAPGTQPVTSTRGSKRVIEALKKLDFYVIVDVTRTADMDYADIVIPVTTPYESEHPFEAIGGRIMARNKVIEPLGDYKSIYEFFLDLGVKMGYDQDFWHGNIIKAMDDQLQPFGMTFAELKKYSTGIIYESIPRTYENYQKVFTRKSPRLSGAPFLPHGKVEIYNTSFEEAGYNPLPEWREPPESLTGTPDLIEKYPLVLSDYHTSKNYTASWERNVPYLRELQPYPTIHIHPDTAMGRGINNNDWVIVESPHGWMKVKAEFYPGIRPDTVMILHGWWQGCQELGLKDFPLLDGGANVNMMYSVDPEKAFDPIITAMSSQTLVQVRKA